MKRFDLGWKNYGWLLLPLVIGIFAALIAWYIVADHVQRLEDELVQTYRQSDAAEQDSSHAVDVVVAADNLPPGAQLTVKNLQVRSLNRNALPMDSIPASSASSYIGRYLRSDLPTAILRGKAIQELHLRPPQEQRLSHHLSAEETAFSFRVNEVQHHAGNLYVGDQLDIYARHPAGSELLMTGVSVLAIDGQFGYASDERVGRSSQALLTIAVPNQILPQLQSAQDTDQLQIFLRHPQLTQVSPRRIGHALVEWILPLQSNNHFSLQRPFEANQGW